MDELYATPRPRVTASMLPKYVGNNVTMVGLVDSGDIASDGNSFRLKVDDKTAVTVVMNTPLNELLEDVVEVTGTVNNQSHLQCITYRKITSTVEFSLDNYNKTVELAHSHPEYCTYK
ncbi:replication protein A 14 kDa subunit-like [Clavelina lepadiformis]|uniref:Replication protein A3 n=1 Tax=Clavelina lepadiformis TaxID=159417 RepID=A0ABP0H046_CLALP